MSAIVCIDFGTSMSKVAFHFEDVTYPVPLGELCGDPVKQYPYDSSLLFSRDGRVYVGYEAISKSMDFNFDPQPRFDSIKRLLTTGKMDNLDKVMIPNTLNKTGIAFSIQDALILLLSHLLALTGRYVEESYGEVIDECTELRFTRPAFNGERERWVDETMCHAISAAKRLWKNIKQPDSGFIMASNARKLLDRAKSEAHPMRMKGIPEPLAASVLHLSDPNTRSVSVIVDIGAGTTDMGLFVAVQPARAHQIRQAEVLSSPLSVAKAGDHLDKILKSMLVGSEKLNSQHKIEIDLNIRRWKEQLFRFGETEPTLSGGKALGRVLRHQFEDDKDYCNMLSELNGSLGRMLYEARNGIAFFANASIHFANHIQLIPAGGGAKLPLVEKLSKIDRNEFDCPLPIRLMPPIPPELAEYGDEFPQLAVALGGAAASNPTFKRWN